MMRSPARAEEFPDELNGQVFTTRASLRAGGYRLWSGLERDGRRQATSAQDSLHEMNNKTKTIPDRSPPGSTRTAPSVCHQGGGDKCATGGTPDGTPNGNPSRATGKIRERDYITIGTWNVRTLAQTGKLQELLYELDRYTWHLVGLCEVRWKEHGEHHTDEGHVLYYNGDQDKHINGVGMLVNKNIKNSVIGYCPVNSRLMTIRLKAAPFNITVIQAYAPTMDHDDEEVEEFFNQLQDIIDKVNKKDILIIQGDWNAKVGGDARKDWNKFCGPSCNATTNERGLRLLEFASYNDTVLANTLGEHKASRRWTWRAPNGIHHNQIDYILVQNRFRSGINRAKTRTFPGADMGSDHDLVFLNFRFRLKKISKPKNIRLKFNLDLTVLFTNIRPTSQRPTSDQHLDPSAQHATPASSRQHM